MKTSHTSLRVFVVEDQTMFLEMLCSLLSTLRGVEVVGTATSIATAVAQIPRAEPDVIIVDRLLPDGDGCDLVAALRTACRPSETILLSAQTADLRAPGQVSGGRLHIVDKMDTFRKLSLIFQAILACSANEDSPSAVRNDETLTPRESEVLHWVGKGLLNKQIADQLGISQRTIETHRKAISKKLRLSGSELVSYATLQNLHP